MISLFFNLNPIPCISVKPNILPPDIDFNILVVACPTFGLLVLPVNVAATLTAGLRNLFQAVCVPLKIDFSLLFIEPPSS